MSMKRTWDTEAVKQQLLDMAKAGEPRPYVKEWIGQKLSFMLCSSHKYHEAEFKNDLMRLRPDWFDRSSRPPRNKWEPKVVKARVLQIAKSGGKRPTRNQEVGRYLSHMLCASHRYYDPDLAAELSAIRPDWFK